MFMLDTSSLTKFLSNQMTDSTDTAQVIWNYELYFLYGCHTQQSTERHKSIKSDWRQQGGAYSIELKSKLIFFLMGIFCGTQWTILSLLLSVLIEKTYSKKKKKNSVKYQVFFFFSYPFKLNTNL